jgi:diguanylate cyclase (GGDEF)-like protein
VAHLGDRGQLLTAIDESIGRCRAEPAHGFSVLLLELDRLTMLVGSYGQQVVDKLLAEIARRLVTLLRPADIVAQIGSGEFGILLYGTGKAAEAGIVVDRIQKTVGERYRIGGHTMTISSVIGMATSERSYASGDQLLRDAAVAASRARRQRRKRRAVFQTQMRVEDKRFMSMVDQLHNALQQRQFLLHYQPIIELADRRLCGFEALVRWDHPGEGLISPGEFIPIAEETGMIVALGQFVLEEACQQMADWNRQFAPQSPLYVSVNLSPTQFAEDDLSNHIEHALGRAQLDARQLHLEITETAVLENPDAATVVLERLKARGVKVSLDDFGTGYSSFSQLHQLPYDTLKIDRSFVARIGADGEHVEIIHAIISLAHNLGLAVVAEGVETEPQATQLERLGCEYAQGFYFARPLDVRAAQAMLSS